MLIADYCYVGKDISRGTDCSAISYICGNCKNIFGFASVEPGEKLPDNHPKECPVCGIPFSKHVVLGE
jgi:DNA-directed RNA polymerase subunit RPC12/RpoP